MKGEKKMITFCFVLGMVGALLIAASLALALTGCGASADYGKTSPPAEETTLSPADGGSSPEGEALGKPAPGEITRIKLAEGLTIRNVDMVRPEGIESGEMSVRDMKVEIAKLRMKNEAQAKALEQDDRYIANLEKDVNEMNALLEEERRKPAPEPVVQEVIIHSPSDEDIEKIRAAEEERLHIKFEVERTKTLKECREAVAAAEKARDKAVEKAEKEANDAGELAAKMEKIKADHKAAMDKLKADHEKKIAEMEASYKKQAKASTAGADANVVRIQLALENFKRDVLTVAGILGKMKAEGGEQEQKADKLRANVEKILGALIAEAGWTV